MARASISFVREFDRAFADLTRGGAIDSTIYRNLVPLGVVHYLRGNFAEAAASFAKAQPIAPDAGELACYGLVVDVAQRAVAALKRRRCSIGGRIRSR